MSLFVLNMETHVSYQITGRIKSNSQMARNEYTPQLLSASCLGALALPAVILLVFWVLG